MATMQLPAMGYGLRYEYGIFRQSIRDGWQVEQPDNWLRRPDPWEVPRPEERVEIRLNASFEVSGGTLRLIAGKPSSLFGIPYDRPIVGYGGRTINTLRLWAAATTDDFDFQAFSKGDFVAALAETLAAETLTRVLYPDDSTSQGQGLRFVQEYFLVACSLADLVRRFRHCNADWSELPEKVAIQMNDTHPSMAVPELMRLLLDEAHLQWDQSWDLTQRTLAYTNHTLLPEALEKWPLPMFEALLPRHLEIILEINRRLLACTGVGFLAGLVLAAPLFGAALGAILGGAGTAVAAHAGISEDFIQEVESMMKPGTSVLFVLAGAGDMEMILHAIRGLGGTVVKTNVDRRMAELIQSTLSDAFKG